MKNLLKNKSVQYIIIITFVFVALHFIFIIVGKFCCFEKYSDSVAALFSGLAFVFLIISIQKQTQAIKLQRKEFKQQLKEYKNSLEEQKKANMEFNKQNKNIELQKFENSFFHLLQNIFSISQSLKLRISGEVFLGNDVFNQIWAFTYSDTLGKMKGEKLRLNQELNNNDKLDVLRSNFYINYPEHYSENLNIYFRSLLFCLNYILTSEVISEERKSELKVLLRFQIHDCAVYLIGMLSIFAKTNVVYEYQKLVNELSLSIYFNEDDIIKKLILAEMKKFTNN